MALRHGRVIDHDQPYFKTKSLLTQGERRPQPGHTEHNAVRRYYAPSPGGTGRALDYRSLHSLSECRALLRALHILLLNADKDRHRNERRGDSRGRKPASPGCARYSGHDERSAHLSLDPVRQTVGRHIVPLPQRV